VGGVGWVGYNFVQDMGGIACTNGKEDKEESTEGGCPWGAVPLGKRGVDIMKIGQRLRKTARQESIG